MKIIKLIFKNFFVSILFLIIIGIIITNVFLSIWDYNTPKIELSGITSTIGNIATFLSVIVALSIPFLLKQFEENKKIEDEKKIIVLTFKRLDRFFEYLIAFTNQKQSLPNKFSGTMPFFTTIFQKYPEILIKIGLELNTISWQSQDIDLNPHFIKEKELLILNKYKLRLSPSPSLIDLSTGKKLTPDIQVVNQIIIDLIENFNTNFDFTISITDFNNETPFIFNKELWENN